MFRRTLFAAVTVLGLFVVATGFSIGWPTRPTATFGGTLPPNPFASGPEDGCQFDDDMVSGQRGAFLSEFWETPYSFTILPLQHRLPQRHGVGEDDRRCTRGLTTGCPPDRVNSTEQPRADTEITRRQT